MSQSPGAGSAAAAATTTVSSSPCQELSAPGKGSREGRVPLEGAPGRARRLGGRAGQVQPGKLRQSTDRSLQFRRGGEGGGWGGRGQVGGCA